MPNRLRVVAGAERRFAALAKAGRRPARAGAAVRHAVTPRARMALCAAEPGAGSGWAAAEPGRAVTCPACLRRLETLARAGAAVVVLGGSEEP